MVGLVPFVLWMDGWIDMRYLMLTGRVGPSWSVGTMGPGWNKYHYVGRGPRWWCENIRGHALRFASEEASHSCASPHVFLGL